MTRKVKNLAAIAGAVFGADIPPAPVPPVEPSPEPVASGGIWKMHRVGSDVVEVLTGVSWQTARDTWNAIKRDGSMSCGHVMCTGRPASRFGWVPGAGWAPLCRPHYWQLAIALQKEGVGHE